MALRLTLRTLLAYLDMTLDAAAARDIGERIADNPHVQELIDRILVVCRRPLPPGQEQSRLDANAVAEYLDNVLPAEEVAELERQGLGRDADLAEVASLHQILALVLEQPAAVPAAARERIHAIVSKAASTPPPAESEPLTADDAPPQTTAESTAAADAMAWSVPRIALGVGVIAFLLVLGGIAYKIPSGVAPTPSAKDYATAPVPADSADSEDAKRPSPLEPSPKPTVSEPIADATTAPEPAPAAAASPMPTPSTSEAPKAPEAPATAVDAAVTPDTPVPPPNGAPAEPTPAKVGEEDKEEKPATTPRADLPLATYVSPTGMLLMRSLTTPRSDWIRIRPDTRISDEGELAGIDGGRAELELADNARLEVVGGARLHLARDPETHLPIVDLRQGRLLLRTEQQPTQMILPLAGDRLQVRVLTPQSVVALEARDDPAALDTLPQAEQAATSLAHKLRLQVVRGEVELSTGGGRKTTLLGGDLVEARPVVGLDTPRPADEVIEWIVDAPLSSAEQRDLDRLLTRVDYGQSARLAFREGIEDRSPRMRRIGVHGLAAIRGYDGLIQALRQETHDDVRQEAIAALRTILRIEPTESQQVRGTLLDYVDPADADTIVAMLRGYPPDAADGAAPYAMLVEQLEAPSVLMRELAIVNLRELTGRDFGFVANAPPPRRRTSLTQWQRWLTDWEAKNRRAAPAAP